MLRWAYLLLVNFSVNITNQFFQMFPEWDTGNVSVFTRRRHEHLGHAVTVMPSCLLR